MPERHARIETWRVGTPLTVGAVTLLPIEHIVQHSERSRRHCWLTATKVPYAIVLCDQDGVRAIGADARPIALEQLRQRVPELDAALASV
jgi:hypothetical protein